MCTRSYSFSFHLDLLLPLAKKKKFKNCSKMASKTVFNSTGEGFEKKLHSWWRFEVTPSDFCHGISFWSGIFHFSFRLLISSPILILISSLIHNCIKTWHYRPQHGFSLDSRRMPRGFQHRIHTDSVPISKLNSAMWNGSYCLNTINRVFIFFYIIYFAPEILYFYPQLPHPTTTTNSKGQELCRVIILYG